MWLTWTEPEQVFQTICYYHVRYEFQSESTRYNLLEYQRTPCLKQAYLTFKLQQRDSNPQPNHLVCKQTLNHLAKLWLNGWMLANKLSSCGFESRCCDLRNSECGCILFILWLTSITICLSLFWAVCHNCWRKIHSVFIYVVNIVSLNNCLVK